MSTFLRPRVKHPERLYRRVTPRGAGPKGHVPKPFPPLNVDTLELEAAIAKCDLLLRKYLVRYPERYIEEILHESKQRLRRAASRWRRQSPLEHYLFAVAKKIVRAEAVDTMKRLCGSVGDPHVTENRIRETALSLEELCEQSELDELAYSDRGSWRKIDSVDCLRHFWRRAWQVLDDEDRNNPPHPRGRNPPHPRGRKPRNPRVVVWFWSLYGRFECRLLRKEVASLLRIQDSQVTTYAEQATEILERAGLQEILE